jgi:hypothetical protein
VFDFMAQDSALLLFIQQPKSDKMRLGDPQLFALRLPSSLARHSLNRLGRP